MSFNSCLLGVPIFKDLDTQDLEAISNLIEPVDLTKDQPLFQVGDDLNHLYILHKGALKVYGLAENGNVSVLRLLKEGDFIGEHALLSQEVSEVSVEAMNPSHVCMIRGSEFKNLLNQSPELSMKIIQALLKRLKDSDERSTAQGTLSARERLIQALNDLKDEKGLVRLSVAKKDFAASLGMAQETLSRLLKSLEDQGLIELEGHRKIFIKETLGD